MMQIMNTKEGLISGGVVFSVGGLFLENGSSWAAAERATNASYYRAHDRIEELREAFFTAKKEGDFELAGQIQTKLLQAEDSIPDYINSEWIDDVGTFLWVVGAITVAIFISLNPRRSRQPQLN